MRVLHFLADSTLLSGISRHVENLSLGMIEAKVDNLAVCTIFPEGDLNSSVRRAGGESFSLRCYRHNSIKILWRFHQVIRAYNPDVIHIHVMVFWVWVYLALCGRKVRVVRTIHSVWGHTSFVKRIVCSLLPIRFHHYYFVSNAVREFCKKNLVTAYNNGEVVYNPAPRLIFDKKHLLREILGLPDKTMIIGTACKIGQVKRLDRFVRVMMKVLQHAVNIHAVIVGDGPGNPIDQLKKIVEPSGVGDRFHFLGYRDDSQILTSGMTIFVMTSEREGMPTALLEAIGVGVPVVFMNGRGGLQDLVEINHGKYGPFGVDVNQGDEDAMVSEIAMLLNDPIRYGELSSNGLNICKELFDREKIVTRLLKSYK